MGWSGVVFDFDETLVHTQPAVTEALRIVSKSILNYLREHGVYPQLEDLCRVSRQIADEMDQKTLYDRNLWWEIVISQFLDTRPEVSLLSRLTDKYWAMVTKRSALYDDALHVLRRLRDRDYRLGLMTDTDGVKGMKRERIKAIGLDRYVDAIVIAGEDSKKVKPDEEPFHLVAQRLGLPPSKCVFVGDKPFTDMKGAQEAGMGTILIRRRQWNDETKADIVVNNLSDLEQVL